MTKNWMQEDNLEEWIKSKIPRKNRRTLENVRLIGLLTPELKRFKVGEATKRVLKQDEIDDLRSKDAEDWRL